MPKVIITIGIPASGKSTWAKDYAKKNPNTVIVCRDDIRAAHDFPFGDREIEDRITVIERGQIEIALLSGLDVIVADTNINKTFRNRLVKFCHQHGADVLLMPFPISLDEAIVRDAQRWLPVGSDVVTKFYNQLKDQGINADPVDLPVRTFEPYEHRVSQFCGGFGAVREVFGDAICVDIDGTVARHWNRSPYEYGKVSDDEPIDDVVSVIEALAETYHVIFVSGRDDVCRKETEEWINEHIYLPHDFQLFMRKTGDQRPDWEIKNEIYDTEIIPKYNVHMVFDDRDQVVRHLRKRGLTVAQVAPGRF